jgi:hypothetical protein
MRLAQGGDGFRKLGLQNMPGKNAAWPRLISDKWIEQLVS